MTTNPFTEKALREEWQKDCEYDSNAMKRDKKGLNLSCIIFSDDADKIADHWLKKFSDYKAFLREEAGKMKGPSGTREDKYSEGRKNGINETAQRFINLLS